MLPENLTPQSLLNLEANPHLRENRRRLALMADLADVHVERFVKGIKYEPDPRCWIWILGHGARGRGMFNINRKLHYIHRLSHELFIGPIPSGLCVCHSCDVKNCANPYHYFLGTRDDNNKDAASKGITCHGEEKPAAKLSCNNAKEIRERYAKGGIYQRDLAKEYGVDQAVISRTVNLTAWRHTK